MRSKLLSETRLRQLLGVKSIPEMIELLEETEYKEDFVAQSTKYSGMELMMRALHENFKHSLQKLIRINPEEGKLALRLLLQEYEIQNINTIISAKAGELPLADTDLMIIEPGQQKLAERLLLAKNIGEILKRLRKTEYGRTLKAAEREYEKSQDFRDITKALSAYYYAKLHAIRPDHEDLLWKLIDLRNSVKNITVVLRVKRANPNADALAFLPSREDRFLREINKMNDYSKIMQRVAQKRPKLAGAIEECEKKNTLIPLEIALEKGFIDEVLRLLQFAVLDFAAILGYLYLKELEVAAIRKIAYAKQYGFQDELKGMIFSFNAG